ncbi:unnamed protein product [Rhizoctonia solani]|uniref:Aldehyde dehydrogenase domain-containing protein n=1 Tax=Rhizoctonia solani TaxID=456999 RepID=A0A8H3CYP9_9AGAM|nr:unnamed protein product [Rhizoctonia solani]
MDDEIVYDNYGDTYGEPFAESYVDYETFPEDDWNNADYTQYYGAAENEGIDIFIPLLLFTLLGIYLVYNRYHTIRNRPVRFAIPPPDASFINWRSLIIPNPHLMSHQDDPMLLPSHSDPAWRDMVQAEGSEMAEMVPERKFVTSFDPSTGQHIATIPCDRPIEIHHKIQLAQRAQTYWARSSWVERRRVLRSLLRWTIDEKETIARVCCRDTGKTMVDAAFGEILTTCSKANWLINNGEKTLRTERRAGNILLAHKISTVQYEPLGVVSAIVSWNYPFHNVMSPIMAALTAGNGIVIKCSEHVAWSSRYFVAAIRECLRACRWDPDLVQLVVCLPEDAEALTTSPLIRHISFIGSEEVGRRVAIAATTHLTPCTLELGGKDPAIVLPGTDVMKWAGLWMRGVFQASGQNCIGIERFIVHSSVYPQFMAEMDRRIKLLRTGSVLNASAEGFVQIVDVGAQISSARFAELERLIQAAVEDGADLVVGGGRWRNPFLEEGLYFSPTLLGNVSDQMEIAQTEVFAPIMLVMPYDTVPEAIEIANSTRYGLGASVWGPDETLCAHVARELECGMVSINDFGVFYLNQDLPFGGVKASGYGRFGGPEGLRSLTNPKAVIVDKWPWLIRTQIPRVLDYPVGSLVKSWFVSFLFHPSTSTNLVYKEQFDGLVKLARAARQQ